MARPNVQLMCDTFQNEIYQNETWTANVNLNHSVLGTSGHFFKAPLTQQHFVHQQILYDAAGLIYLGALGLGPLASTNWNKPRSSGLANWAVWNLFDPRL